MSNVIEVHSNAVQALLSELQARIERPEAVLKAIGEDAVERIKLRFETSTGPDGARWQPNSPTTLINYITQRGGFSRKTGKINAKGQKIAMGKKPLIGEGRDLSRQIYYDVAGETLTIGSSMKYAAMQHFGGTKAEFPHLWGDIPARPFMPVMPSGELYPREEAFIVESLRGYLTQ